MDSTPYTVLQDGRPLRRGLTRRAAESFAAQMASGFEARCTSDKRRVAEFEIRRDTAMVAEHDANYKRLKENR